VDGYFFFDEIRVRFAETDAQGIAHHSNYVVWFEVARVAYLARFREGYRSIQADGVEVLVTDIHARFVAPAYFDDTLRIHTRCVGLRGARFRFDYVVERDGTLIVDGHTGHASVVGTTLQPTRTPAWLVEAITSAER
jgi:acyl-CoA thioester hydrolase